MSRFFVSYTTADQAWAEWIAWSLEELGHETILQSWDFQSGSDFVLEMQRAATECDHTIAVLSPDYFRSKFGATEWAAAFSQDPTGEEGLLIPVRVKDFRPPGLFRSRVYVDLVGKSEEDAIAELEMGISRERRRPQARPAFPALTDPGRMSTPGFGESPAFPGSEGRVWNLPPESSHLSGRTQELAVLERNFLSEEKRVASAQVLIQVIHGLPGVGKTRLALRYAYRCSDRYDIAWWMRADESATLTADFVALGQRLGIGSSRASSRPLKVEDVRNLLEQEMRSVLLIFDNARAYEELKSFLPRLGRCHVIISSQRRDWVRATSVQLEPLPPRESEDLLLNRTGIDDSNSARVLAEELGGLPLALEQAAAFIEARGLSISEYISRFRQQREVLFEANRPADYPHTVVTALNMSIEAVVAASDSAGLLANLLAFLAPDQIPLDVLATHVHVEECPAQLAGVLKNQPNLDDAITTLRRYSLIQNSSEWTVSIHRLVQEALRRRLPIRERMKYASFAVSLLSSTFPGRSFDRRNWAFCRRLLSHGLSASSHAEFLAVAPEATAMLLNHIGLFLREQGDLSDAKRALEEALDITECIPEPSDARHSKILSNLAGVLTDMGALDRACEYLRQAVAIEELHSVASGVTFNNLGTVYLRLGSLAAAKHAFKRALELLERPGNDHQEHLGTTLANLAELARLEGDFKFASTLSSRALDLLQSEGQADQPRFALALKTHAGILAALGNAALAKIELDRALAVLESAYGPQDWRVGITRGTLAQILEDAGDHGDAMVQYNSAISILDGAKELVRDELPVLIEDSAKLLLTVGEVDEAKLRFELAFSHWKDKHDQSALEVASRLINLNMEDRDGDSEIRWILAALEIRRSIAPSHQEGVLLFRLAQFASAMGRADLELRLLIATYVTDQKIRHPDAAERDLPLVREAAAEVGLSDHQLDQLIVEVEQELVRDRGERLILSAFSRWDAH